MSEMTFTAVVVKEGNFFVAECPEVGTKSLGKSRIEAIKNLGEANDVFLKEFPPKD